MYKDFPFRIMHAPATSVSPAPREDAVHRRRFVLRSFVAAVAGYGTTVRARAASVVGGVVSPAVAPGFRLRLAFVVRPPEWAADFGDGALVTCVVAGELAVEMTAGTAAVWRASLGAAGSGGEPVLPGAPTRLGAGDCFAADPDRPTTGSLRNPGPVSAEVWEAGLSPEPLSRLSACSGSRKPAGMAAPTGGRGGVR